MSRVGNQRVVAHCSAMCRFIMVGSVNHKGLTHGGAVGRDLVAASPRIINSLEKYYICIIIIIIINYYYYYYIYYCMSVLFLYGKKQ